MKRLEPFDWEQRMLGDNPAKTRVRESVFLLETLKTPAASPTVCTARKSLEVSPSRSTVRENQLYTELAALSEDSLGT